MKNLYQAMLDGELTRNEWTWPVQLKLTGDQILIRPMHRISTLSDTYTPDHDTEPEYQIEYTTDNENLNHDRNSNGY